MTGFLMSKMLIQDTENNKSPLAAQGARLRLVLQRRGEFDNQQDYLVVERISKPDLFGNWPHRFRAP